MALLSYISTTNPALYCPTGVAQSSSKNSGLSWLPWQSSGPAEWCVWRSIRSYKVWKCWRLNQECHTRSFQLCCKGTCLRFMPDQDHKSFSVSLPVFYYCALLQSKITLWEASAWSHSQKMISSVIHPRPVFLKDTADRKAKHIYKWGVRMLFFVWF